MESDGQVRAPASPSPGIVATTGVLLVAALLGSAAGAFMAWIAPSDKFSWAGMAVAPLWLLLEIFFEAVSGAARSFSKIARGFSILVVLGGFYVVWLYLRGI